MATVDERATETIPRAPARADREGRGPRLVLRRDRRAGSRSAPGTGPLAARARGADGNHSVGDRAPRGRWAAAADRHAASNCGCARLRSDGRAQAPGRAELSGG